MFATFLSLYDRHTQHTVVDRKDAGPGKEKNILGYSEENRCLSDISYQLAIP